MDCPFDPTPPNPLRFGLDLDEQGRPRPAGFRLPASRRDEEECHPGTPEGTATLRDYCRRHRIKIRPDGRRSVAILLVEMTRRARMGVGHVPDPRFGRVNCYPIEVLDRWRATLMR